MEAAEGCCACPCPCVQCLLLPDSAITKLASTYTGKGSGEVHAKAEEGDKKGLADRGEGHHHAKLNKIQTGHDTQGSEVTKISSVLAWRWSVSSVRLTVIDCHPFLIVS